MFWFLIIIFLLTIFFYKQRNLNKYLYILLLSYFVSLSSIILYISKDIYYYNQIKIYFDLPNFLWRWLFFINIDKSTIIRLMNISSIAIVIVNTYFVFSYFKKSFFKLQSFSKKVLLLYGILTYIIYDPSITIGTYYFLYPDYLTVDQFTNFEHIIFQITHEINISIILLDIALLIYALYKAPKLRVFKFNHIFLNFSYGIFSLVYIYFISATPNYLLKISKISDTITYESFKLGNNALFYRIFPILIIIAVILITYCTYRLAKINSEEALEEICISKEINASETTSKIFCHYIKNEILAIQSELQLLPKKEDSQEKDDSQEVVDNIINRCSILYDRIDEIHRSTKTNKLNLKLCCLQDIINHTISIFACELKDIELSLDVPDNKVLALVDKVYLEQALHNIIKNSLDAMGESTVDCKKLKVGLKIVYNWVQITIEDTGCGISKENLNKIFHPLYSSHSYSKHWGIGLTLTYKIIQAHEGKILVDSTVSLGTTINILLPYVNY